MELNNQFKIGDWVFRTSTSFDDSHHYYGKVFQVQGFRRDQVVDQGDVGHLFTSVRHATKKEIKQFKNQNKMKTKKQPNIVGKTKKAFHTFELEGRKVTIGVLGNGHNVVVGYSICHPDDEFNQELARKISIGRAESKNNLESYYLNNGLATDYGVLKSIAHRWERTIKEDPTIIGIYGNKR